MEHKGVCLRQQGQAYYTYLEETQMVLGILGEMDMMKSQKELRMSWLLHETMSIG